MYLALDEATLEVRAVEITGSGVGYAPMPPSLLSQIPADEPIASVTADGAYDSRAGRDAVAMRDADAISPPRRNAKSRKKDSPGAAGRNDAARHQAACPDDPAQVEPIPPPQPCRVQTIRYHASPNPAGQRMNCMKLLGQRLMSRNFDRQTAELRTHIAILNRFTALGIPVTQPVVEPQTAKRRVLLSQA